MSAVELVAFVRAALDEDERVINGSCLHIDDCNGSGFPGRFDDDRLLAEVEAKRRILDEYERANRPLPGDDPMVAQGEQVMGERVIELLAQPYAGQPGWHEEWADVR